MKADGIFGCEIATWVKSTKVERYDKHFDYI